MQHDIVTETVKQIQIHAVRMALLDGGTRLKFMSVVYTDSFVPALECCPTSERFDLALERFLLVGIARPQAVVLAHVCKALGDHLRMVLEHGQMERMSVFVDMVNNMRNLIELSFAKTEKIDSAIEKLCIGALRDLLVVRRERVKFMELLYTRRLAAELVELGNAEDAYAHAHARLTENGVPFEYASWLALACVTVCDKLPYQVVRPTVADAVTALDAIVQAQDAICGTYFRNVDIAPAG